MMFCKLRDRKQYTVKSVTSIRGIGLFSGKKINLQVNPALENQGIIFRRIDLPGKPIVEASIDNVVDTTRCCILSKNGVIVKCVEHILSAIKALDIDNLTIDIDGEEVPIMDGSSIEFTEMLQRVGIDELDESIDIFALQKPLYFSNNEATIVALPSDILRFSYTLNYPDHQLLSSQFHTIELRSDNYLIEIAPCRTFCTYDDAVELLGCDFIKGGSLDNSIVVNDEKVLNSGGLRFKNEMARHKILDLIGDTSLIDCNIVAHFISIRCGHFDNIKLSKIINTYIRNSLCRTK